MGVKAIREYKGKSLIAFPNNFIVIDVETTGLDSQYDEIIELSAIRMSDNSIVNRFSSLVKPNNPIDEFISDLTGITNEMVRYAPKIEDILLKFKEFLQDDLLVGHNVNFDINFIYDNLQECYDEYLNNNFIDTMRISRRVLTELSSHRLKDLANFYNIDTEGSHRALKDCEITAKVYENLIYSIQNRFGGIEAFVEHSKVTGKHSSIRAKDITTVQTVFDLDNPLLGKYCVITGKLEKMLRKEAMQMIANLGGINEDRVTRLTNYLILGNNDYNPILRGAKSSKLKKAEKKKLDGEDIEILSENVFYEMIGDELQVIENNPDASLISI
jgi:DNA polymerase-3 subunit epsilon